MAKIKHNFMKGKMNKDLDERLVPNGEYRDALNIQVSTSEGSDVGTVQNILGNSLIAGQDFIGDGSVCVGSIADEKNDKLYYFIVNNEELIVNGGFYNDLSGWWLSTGWELKNGKIEGDSVVANDKINQSNLPIDKFILDREYEVSFTVSGYVAGNINVKLRNENGKGFNIPNFVPENKTYTFTGKVGTHNTTNTTFYSRFYIQAGDIDFTGNIDNISIKPKDSAIIEYDGILEYDSKTNSITPVFVDVTGDVLKFHKDNIITGINIIDDLLLWTDNVNEPKKINITRSKAGTDSSGLSHTNLIVEGEERGLIKEDHITVIKKSPSSAPTIISKKGKRGGFIRGRFAIFKNYFYPPGNPPQTILEGQTIGREVNNGDEMWIRIDSYIRPDIKEDDVLLAYRQNNAFTLPTDEPVARLLIKQVAKTGRRVSQAQNNFADINTNASVIAWSSQTAIKVSVMDFESHTPAFYYSWKLEHKSNVGIFERKFPRFACRYRYEDNEYSSIGPFSEVVFHPGEFEYHPTEAYNKGMINRLRELTLTKFAPSSMPLDVVGVDLLYKNEFSPSIYLVKSVSRDDWGNSEGYYPVASENVHYAQLPSNQLIRPWDNVPKTALAQEVTGNRVVYSNYTQGYDITDTNGNLVNPKVKAEITSRAKPRFPSPSIKSERTYNFGVVYGDKYGRETPVFTSKNANVEVDKALSSSASTVVASIESSHPSWADYYKVFVKETANEYYNLAMGRVYDAEDSGVWISFPSVDRNKVDEDTYLVLKKGVGNESDVGKPSNTSTRYKIVAIENEAPEYIKTEYTLLAEVTKKNSGAMVFGGMPHPCDNGNARVELPAEFPAPGSKSFTLNKIDWEEVGDQPAGTTQNDVGPTSRVERQHGLPQLTNDEKTGLWDTRGDAEIYVSFSNKNRHPDDTGSPLAWSEAPVQMSKKYKVIDIEIIDGTFPDLDPKTNPATENPGYSGDDLYRVLLSDVIPSSESYLTDYAAIGYGAKNPNYNSNDHLNYRGGGLIPHFYKKEVKNKPEFDGRFFVKVFEDEALKQAIRVEQDIETTGYSKVASIPKLFHLRDGTGSGDTGQDASTTREHWEENSYQGNQSFDTTGKWFIDETAFAGVQPADKNNPSESIVTQDGTALCDVTTPTAYAKLTDGDTDSPFFEVIDYSWGTGSSVGSVKQKGAHDAQYTGLQNMSSSGENTSAADADKSHYLSLSFTGIGPALNPEYNPVSPWNKEESEYDKPDYWDAKWYRSYYWEGFQDLKSWNVGGSYVSNNVIMDSQGPIVAQLKKDSLFRLLGDDSIYRILGVTKRKLYNYMGKIRWNDPEVLSSIPGTLWFSPSKRYVAEENNAIEVGDDNYDSLSGLGGYLLKGGEVAWESRIETEWRDANDKGKEPDNQGEVPDAVLNTINPADLEDLVYNQNLALQPGLDATLYNTSRRIQHQNMTSPLNCRLNYLIQYEVVGDSTGDEDITTNTQFKNDNGGSVMSVSNSRRLDFLQEFTSTERNPLTKNPAIFETEPKEDSGLDIYYEASGRNPINISPANIHQVIQIGAIMQVMMPASVSLSSTNVPASGIFINSIVKEPNYTNVWRINLSANSQRDYYGIEGENGAGTEIRFYNDDGSFGVTTLRHVVGSGSASYVDENNLFVPRTSSTGSQAGEYNNKILVEISNDKIGLGWFNCWSFGNGVESNRIGDTYNKPFITNGVKASTTLLDYYKEEQRKHGLIYSGIYNSTSGVNNLNQFIAAEKITKDINPIYGSIQKLHSRSTADGDLIVLCEDRVLKILANKDALFNADGNPQLIATDRVLGQASPFSGDFGISKNPESFASASYRIYFTDKVRGAVVRLSKDGLTPISNHGMKDWFRDNLKLSTKLIGSYDDRNDEYNITLSSTVAQPSVGETVTFKEDVKGWVSFKSFIPENAISMANDYYTMLDGKLHEHHVENVNRNNFYGIDYNSSVNVLLNEGPESVKSFHTLSYEGSQSRIQQNLGPDLISNGSFTSSNGWSLSGGTGTQWIIGGGVAKAANFPDYGFMEQSVPGIVEGKYYRITYDIVVASAGGQFILANHTTVASTLNSDASNNDVRLINETVVGTHSISWLQGPTNTGKISLYNDSAFDGTIDNISVKEIGFDKSSYYNLIQKHGWYVSSIETNKQKGSIHEFIEKEGKWFNYIKGIDSDITSETNLGAFNIQGLGGLAAFEPGVYYVSGGQDSIGEQLTIDGAVNQSLQIGDVIYYTPSSLKFITVTNVTLPGSGSSNEALGAYAWDWDVNLFSEMVLDTTILTANYEFEGKQYRNGQLIYSGPMIALNNTNGIHLRRNDKDYVSGLFQLDGQWEVGDVLTTQAQEDKDLNFTSSANSIIKYGTVNSIVGSKIEVIKPAEDLEIITTGSGNTATVTYTTQNPNIGDFILFKKNSAVNTSSLLGYYADVKFENNSDVKAEILSISSEVTQSSK